MAVSAAGLGVAHWLATLLLSGVMSAFEMSAAHWPP